MFLSQETSQKIRAASWLVNAAAGNAGALRRKCTDSYVENRIHRSLVLEMVTTLPTSSETKAQKQAKMAGSPKKATKKKATKAKAKADKPKKPLSGYMKFVKGE